MQAKIHQQIKQLFQNQPISVLDSSIYLKDFESLYHEELLRSQAISFLIAIIKAQYPQLFNILPIEYLLSSDNQYQNLRLRPCKIIQPSVTYMLLFMGEQEYILQSMQSQYLFSYRYLLIPCNTDIKQGGKGSHWFLIIYDTVDNCIYTMDSVYECIHQNAKVMGQRLKKMRKLFKVSEKRKQLIQRYQQKNNSNKNDKIINLIKMQNKDQITVTWLRNVTKQKNSYDCGIYVVGNIQAILQKLIQKQQSNTKHPQQPLIDLDQYKINIQQLKQNPYQFTNLRQKYFYKVLDVLKINQNHRQ